MQGLRSIYDLIFNNISIRTRLLTYFLALVLLPSSIIIVTLYNASSVNNENMKNSIERNMTMMELNLTKSVDEIDNMTTSIYMNSELQSILSSDKPADDYGLINEMTRLNAMLATYSSNERTDNKFQLELYLMDRSEYSRFSFIGNIFNIEVIQNLDWFQSIPFKEKYKVLGLYKSGDSSKDNYSIRFVKRLYALDDLSLTFAGLLTADVSINNFNETLLTMKPSVNSLVYLVNEKGTIMAGSDMNAANEPFKELIPIHHSILSGNGAFMASVMPVNGVSNLVASKHLPTLGWEIITLTPVMDLNGPLVSLRKLMVLIVVVSMILALLLCLVLSNSITNPIRKFIKSIRQAEENLYNVSMDYKRNDEFSYLFQRFNQMIQRTRDLIDRLYISEVTKKKAELEALQAQINPHFLYNTLDSVNWMALKHKAPETSQMVTSLSDFFRLSLNKGQSMIKLEDELNQVVSYLTIQKIKMNQKLSYSIQVSPELYSYITVKLLLQPLVENAIIHGFDKTNGRGDIRIQGTIHKKQIILQVIDNGSGNMDTVAKINELLGTENEGNTSFGIRNVNSRIKQWFGDEYGLHYEVNEDAGLTAIINIPARKTMEEL